MKERVPEWGFFPITTPQQQAEFQEALDLRQRNFNEYLNMPEHKRQAVDYYLESQTPTIAVPIGMQTIDVQKVIRNRPTIQIVNTANLYIDPSCDGDVEKAMFIVYSYETSKNELLRTGKYKNLERINWSSSNPLSQPDHETRTPTTFNFQDEARRKIVAYEYWGYYDIHANGELVPFVATWIDGVLIQMEESPFPDKKLPFVVVPFMPIKKSVYGEPDGELLTENQQILGAVTRGMIDLMGRSANAQQGIPKGFLDAPNRRRYPAASCCNDMPAWPGCRSGYCPAWARMSLTSSRESPVALASSRGDLPWRTPERISSRKNCGDRLMPSACSSKRRSSCVRSSSFSSRLRNSACRCANVATISFSSRAFISMRASRLS